VRSQSACRACAPPPWECRRAGRTVPAARGATVGDTQVHSLRLPSFSVSTETVFAADGERLSIRHDAGGGPEPYVAGTLLAIRAVTSMVGVTRGLDRLL
jgi:4-hydroxy-tetrahydrodipicolinate reductase